MEEKFYYEVSCSAPILGPGEYVYVRYIGTSGTLQCFGNEFIQGGMATGDDGVCRDESIRYGLPRAVEAIWVSYTDRKVYKFSSLIPYDTILALFKDGGVLCVPISENPADDELTKEDEALIDKSLERKVFLSMEEKAKLGEIYAKKDKWLDRLYCFGLCFLSDGKVVLYMKSAVKIILLDWSATGEEVTDDRVLSSVYRTYGKTDMEGYYDVFYSEERPNYAPWRKYMSEYGSAEPLLERYLERFNYTLELEFEDSTTYISEVGSTFANAEDFYPTPRFSEAYKMPAHLKESRMEWNTETSHYTCFMYFNEEEMLRVFDEAYGDDRTQKGELRIKVGKDEWLAISLNVGGRSFDLEKVEMRIFIDPIEKPNGSGKLVFKNCRGDHKNLFADDKWYHSEEE